MSRTEQTLKILQRLEFEGFSGNPVSHAGRATLYYDQAAGKFYISKDGASISEIPALNHAVFASTLGTPVITAAAQVSNARVVSIQLVDANGVNVATKTLVRIWISDAAAGALTGTVPGGTVAIANTKGVIIDSFTAKISFAIVTDATGLIQLSVDDNGSGATWFINVACSDGKVFSTSFVWA